MCKSFPRKGRSSSLSLDELLRVSNNNSQASNSWADISTLMQQIDGLELPNFHSVKFHRNLVFQTRQNCHLPAGRATFESCPPTRKMVRPHIIAMKLIPLKKCENWILTLIHKSDHIFSMRLFPVFPWLCSTYSQELIFTVRHSSIFTIQQCHARAYSSHCFA